MQMYDDRTTFPQTVDFRADSRRIAEIHFADSYRETGIVRENLGGRWAQADCFQTDRLLATDEFPNRIGMSARAACRIGEDVDNLDGIVSLDGYRRSVVLPYRSLRLMAGVGR